MLPISKAGNVKASKFGGKWGSSGRLPVHIYSNYDHIGPYNEKTRL